MFEIKRSDFYPVTGPLIPARIRKAFSNLPQNEIDEALLNCLRLEFKPDSFAKINFSNFLGAASRCTKNNELRSALKKRHRQILTEIEKWENECARADAEIWDEFEKKWNGERPTFRFHMLHAQYQVTLEFSGHREQGTLLIDGDSRTFNNLYLVTPEARMICLNRRPLKNPRQKPGKFAKEVIYWLEKLNVKKRA